MAKACVDKSEAKLLDWAKHHINEVNKVMREDWGDLYDCIEYAQAKAFYADLYTHKDDMLLYYAYNYMVKYNINVDGSELEKLKTYIKTLAPGAAKLEDIKNYCNSLNKVAYKIYKKLTEAPKRELFICFSPY